jgi:predicted transcriptional regulator
MAIWSRKHKQFEQHDQLPLGPLEREVMELLWARGRSSVREVVQDLERPLAYTTVMTTLDRLFKKGLLHRDSSDRAFVYSPVLSRREWEQKRAEDWLSRFLSAHESTPELIVSCLIDAVGQFDEALLDELERQVELKRRELESRNCRIAAREEKP